MRTHSTKSQWSNFRHGRSSRKNLSLHSYPEIIIDVWRANNERDRVCVSDGCHDNTTKTLIPRRRAAERKLFCLFWTMHAFIIIRGGVSFRANNFFSGDTSENFR